jgi:anti-sigma factor ChrR (cupin superfamily)
MNQQATALLDPALRRVTATATAELRPYDRYGAAIPGLSWLPLDPEGTAGGAECFLLRFAPGGASKPHEHGAVEQFLVLEGELEDSDGQVLQAGDFVSYAAGSRHSSRSPKGCLILVFLRAANRLLESAS